ncbi:MAG: hypothetical protein AMJ94_06245 [Deltaproteobacteria bacterium SM23_61]|nr:MAG: hypothetical protein AMJ94_06245 [Deltaproteobacteria bacterium SM23_61]
MKTLILFFAVVLLSFPAANAQTLSRVEGKGIKAEAAKGLAIFGGLVNSKNFKQMGFESVEEVKSAALEVPLKEYIVPLDPLRKYEPNTDPRTLLSDTGEVTYPVRVGDRVRSSLTISKAEGKWKPISFGDANLHKLVARIRDKNSRTAGLQKTDYFIVRIPALSLVFLGYEKEDRLLLVPILDDSAYGFRAGASIQARDVFVAVREAARQHDGLPR